MIRSGNIRNSLIRTTAFFCVWLAGAVFAAPAPVGLATGPDSGTYYAFGRDIATVSQSMGQPVQVDATSGSMDNLHRLTEGMRPDSLGIVQSDILGLLQRSRQATSRRAAASLRLVFPFYQEEVHILARDSVASVADLNGKRLVIGEAGSGSAITGINLIDLLGIQPAQQLQMPPAEAIVAVLSGQADAMVFVGGKPVPLFSHLGDLKTADGGKNAALLKGIHFLPLTDARLMTDYTRAQITPQDYPFLTEAVPTVAVTAVLVAEDYSSGRDKATLDRCAQLQTVGGAIRQNLDYLKRSGHPKWREVDPERAVGNWRRDICAWRINDSAAAKVAPKVVAAPPSLPEKTRSDVLQLLRHGTPAPTP